jgi:hypothetical protein
MVAGGPVRCQFPRMSLFSTLKHLFRPQRLTTRGELKGFLESRAAYLVQKSMMEYCQARANMLFSTLIGESAFRDAYEHARWHAYPAGFAMVTEVAEGLLRPLCAERTLQLHAALLGIAQEVFDAFPLPPEAEEDYWRVALEMLDHELGQVGLGPVKPWRDISERYARAIFTLLPIHGRLKSHDFAMFQNNLRFHLTEIGAELEEKIDTAALVRGLVH